MRAFRASALTAALSLSLLPGHAGATPGAPSATSALVPALGRNVTTGVLPGGGTFIVRHSAAVPVAAIELWYRAPSAGFDTEAVPSLARLAAEVVVASQPITGKSLGTLVNELGGHVSVSVYADSLSVSALVPAPDAATVARVMTTAFFAPVITQDGYHEAQRAVAQEALIASFNADSVARDAIFTALFSDGPAHYPLGGDAQAVTSVPLDSIRAFATRAFRSQNAVFVVSGDVDASVAKAAAFGRPATAGDSGISAEPALHSSVVTAPQSVKKTHDEAGGAYGWAGPPIASEREATAMDFIADYLFRPDVGLVSRGLAQSAPDATVSGQFITLHDPGVFSVTYTGKKPEEAKAAVDAGLATLRKPLEKATFAAALDAFTYHLFSDLQTPLAIADNFGWYTVEGNPAYAPGANGDDGHYLRAAHSLTPAFVAEVAAKYLGTPGVTVVLSPASPAPPASKKGTS